MLRELVRHKTTHTIGPNETLMLYYAPAVTTDCLRVPSTLTNITANDPSATISKKYYDKCRLLT